MAWSADSSQADWASPLGAELQALRPDVVVVVFRPSRVREANLVGSAVRHQRRDCRVLAAVRRGSDWSAQDFSSGVFDAWSFPAARAVQKCVQDLLKTPRSAPDSVNSAPSTRGTEDAEPQLQFLDLRGHMPSTIRLSGQAVRAMWARRLNSLPDNHPYALYVHIPFCPHVCDYCQCSTRMLTSQRQLDEYLDWLDGEIEHFSPVFRRGLVSHSYVGGGTPNTLDLRQLERLLGRLQTAFRFREDARRTFEFLPSALREGQLEMVRQFGHNRLSCGVQTFNERTLLSAKRKPISLPDVGRIIERAYSLGYDEFNIDLIWGLQGETDQTFRENLSSVLRLSPTSVTVHQLVPTGALRRSMAPAELIAMDRAFRELEGRFQPILDVEAPDYVWVTRPYCAVIVKRSFLASPAFSLWYYSDCERIHLDMLGLGRGAASRIMGRCTSQCDASALRYDPDASDYACHVFEPSADAALDALTDLVADGVHDTDTLVARYGQKWVPAVTAALDEIKRAGVVRSKGTRWEYPSGQRVFVDDLRPLLRLAGWFVGD